MEKRLCPTLLGNMVQAVSSSALHGYCLAELADDYGTIFNPEIHTCETEVMYSKRCILKHAEYSKRRLNQLIASGNADCREDCVMYGKCGGV